MTALESRATTAASEEPARRERPARGSTPARLRTIGLVLVVLCLLTALASVLSGGTRSDATGSGGERLAALDYDTAELYQALNGANASAATGLGSDRTSSATTLARYDSYITSAYLRLDHARGALEADGPDAAYAEVIAYELPRYTSAVDAARAQAATDPARAQAELRSAAGLMGPGSTAVGSAILPTAAALAQDQQTALAANYAQAGGFPVAVALAGVVTLLGLAWASWTEARRTKRVVNVGLVAAGALTVVALVWWLAATLIASGHVDDARAHNAGAAELGQVRVTMLQARAAETAVVAPGAAVTPQDLAGAFTRVLGPQGLLDAAQGSVGAAAGPVRGAVTAWQSAIGQYGVGSENSRVTFVQLTTTLDDAINTEQGARTAAVGDSAAALTGLAVGPGVLMVLAAIAVGLGVRVRLREYQG